MFSTTDYTDCLPTPLFPSQKKNFLDISDSSSVSSHTLSRSNSLTLLQDPSNSENLAKSSTKSSATTQNFLDMPVTKPTLTQNQDEEELFSEDLYDRIDEFLDQEGLFISSPSPFVRPRRAKPSMTVVLSTNFLSKSEIGTSTTKDSESSFSDMTGPSFLIRRTISGGFKPNTLSLLMSQMKSESGVDSTSTPFTANIGATVGDIYNEEDHEIDSLE